MINKRALSESSFVIVLISNIIDQVYAELLPLLFVDGAELLPEGGLTLVDTGVFTYLLAQKPPINRVVSRSSLL